MYNRKLFKRIETEGMQEFSVSDRRIPIPDLDDFDNNELHSLYGVHDNAQTIIQMSERGDFVTISPQFLNKWISGDVTMPYDQLVIIDARFDYEFQGGHISGAINVNNSKMMMHIFKRFEGKNAAFVFHCEFSHDRAPNLMNKFRIYDRSQHIYPNLTHKHLFLLSGGYSKFFELYKDKTTGSYLPMRDENHVANGDLKRSYSKYNSDNTEQRRNLIHRFHSTDSIGISSFTARNSSSPILFSDTKYPASQDLSLVL